MKYGCSFTSGKGRHLLVKCGFKKSVLSMHATRKELGTGLVQKILKDLDLK
nr:addiction module toxin, HicA family [Bartonella sp. AR 15-3]